MFKRAWALSATMTAVVVISGAAALAQQAGALSLPADTKTVVQVDVQAMQNSGFGKRLIEMIVDRAMEQVADRFGIDVPSAEDAVGFIGFDPLEEARTITLAVNSFDQPEQGLVAIIEMKKNIGSLEALLPSIPGYSVKSVGSHRIHSASPDGNTSIHLAIHTCGEGNKTLVAGANQDAVKGQLERMDSKEAADQKCLSFQPVGGAMLNVQVLELPPADKLGDGPQAILVTMVKQLAVQLSEKDGKLNLAVNLTGVSDETAEQLDQMLQGVVPMVQDQIGGFAQDLKVTRTGAVVTLAAQMEPKEVANMLEDQFDSVVGMVEGALGNR
ncbi:MAG: hypothetical protein KF752_04225 [Pirellulaceae bacterium]|nr:hypothetical protein [Pirellulaceae bacterium]